MARHRKGRAVDGWLILDKPAGASSAELVARARRALDARKAGHAGTLDPLATGLLAIAFGEATKTVAVAQDGAKTYRFTMRLGQATATDDAEGAVIAESPARPGDGDIRGALDAFRGEILQVPPAHSAVKVGGRRAYALARSGEAPALAPRRLHVARLDLVDRPDPDHAVLEMVCAKGGYVRSIARDLGEALGCHAHVSALRRLASGGFTIEDAVDAAALEEIAEGRRPAPLLPLAAGLCDLPEIAVSEEAAADLRHGRAVACPPPRPGVSAPAPGTQVWASAGGAAVAIARAGAGILKPERVFAAPGTPG